MSKPKRMVYPNRRIYSFTSLFSLRTMILLSPASFRKGLQIGWWWPADSKGRLR